jgi:hypothetical protein
MLKKSASGVLDSSKSSTYPRGYAAGFDSPAALLDRLFEHPAGGPLITDVRVVKAVACPHGFSVACEEVEAGG